MQRLQDTEPGALFFRVGFLTVRFWVDSRRPTVAPLVNIYFDMDYTLIAYTGELRPLARQTLERLKEDGHTLYIWSGVGVRTEEVKRLGLDDLVVDVLEKPTEKFEERLPELGVTVRPDAVVDDHPEIVQHFGGVKVRPYFWPSDSDRELARVYEELDRLARGRDGGGGP